MKKIILLATALIMVGCTKRDSNGYISINTGGAGNPHTEIIDSCEYVSWSYGLAHKGNCRFCKEHRKRELKDIVEQIKENNHETVH